MASIRRRPDPYSSDATSQGVPRRWSSTAATSSTVSTTGMRVGRLARTTSSSQGRSRPSTSLYRNSSALRAWFWVEALTWRSLARWVRKALTSCSPSSSGWRLPWWTMKRRIQRT